MVRQLCESCRINPVEIVDDSDDPAQPYQVCYACDHRLKTLSLRPLEWFNLASVHGPNKHFLHDDFYDDWGHAEQPDEEVTEAAEHPFPVLEHIASNGQRLIDYAMTRYYLTPIDDVLRYMAAQDHQAILLSLQQRVAAADNPAIADACFEVCAYVLKNQAEEWVRDQWGRRDWLHYNLQTFYSLTRAMAAGLPNPEGWDKVASALETLSVSELGEACRGFLPFRSAETLDWMEWNENKMLDDNWGQVAAYSHFSWPRAERWLVKGKPLSLRVLDALLSCYHLDVAHPKGPAPGLEQPGSVEAMTAALNDYLVRDNWPRSRRKVEAIQAYWREHPAVA